MTTKDEERKVLEIIKELVSSIGGKHSYIGMAFEGCFEIAESNIDNDFGCSMMQERDSAHKKIDYLESYINVLERTIREQKEKLDNNIIFATSEKTFLKKILNSYIQSLIDHEKVEVSKIVEFAENTTDQRFKDAVLKHREIEKRQKECMLLLEKFK